MEVVIACHGYQQLAGRFLAQFGRIDNGRRLIVAPEALSRFYVSTAESSHVRTPVGASWMTREARESEIDDYVAYLDTVFARVTDGRPDPPRAVALGFSQGAATAARWVALGRARIDDLILWAGLPPPDLDVVRLAERLGEGRLTIVAGNHDPLVGGEDLRAAERRLRGSALRVEVVRFGGGHHLDLQVLADLLKQT